MNRKEFIKQIGTAQNPEMLRQILIDGEPTQYMISSYGYVVAINYCGNQDFGVLTQGYSGNKENGYLISVLSHNGITYVVRLHRMVAEAFIPNPKNLPVVNHIDGHKTHNYEWNLEWTTPSENVKHAYENGLCKILTGEDNPHCKVSNEAVLQICAHLERGELSIPEISKVVGVSESIIKNIVYHRAHTSVSVNYDFSGYYNRSSAKNKYKKYTDEQIHAVCEEFVKNELTMNEIAEKTGVPYPMVKCIRAGKARQNIASNYDFSGYTRLVS